MKNEKDTAVMEATGAGADGRRPEDIDADLPEEVAEAKTRGKLLPNTPLTR